MVTPPAASPARGLLRAHRGKAILVALALALGLLAAFADALLAGPMRTWAEREMNAQLKGYTLSIGRVRPHLWRVALDLDQVVLVQDRHPAPPVADFAALRFSLSWPSLLRFRLAGDLTLMRPALHIDLTQIQEEARSHVSLKDRGWQRAVESIFPIQLDQVRIEDGSLLYLAGDPGDKPLQLTRVAMVARNVRNKAAATGEFPSPVTLEGALFDTGRIRFRGAADFLREPWAAVRGELRLEQVPLDRLTPLAREYQLKTTGGLLSLDGTVQYTPQAQLAHLAEVRLQDLRVDYVSSDATAAAQAEHARQAAQVARSLRNAPEVVLQVDALRLVDSQIGFVNETTRPPYRVYLSAVNLRLDNLSNQATLGRSDFQAQGAFMGSGATEVSGGFRSTASPVDFQVRLQLDDAQLPGLNPLFLAYSGVDVAEGQFSMYTEVTVKDGHVQGYLKPLIKHLRFYDRAKDQAKPFGKRVELHALQFLASLFRNRRSQAVATVARFQGPTSDPKASEWEVIRRLIGNGFAQAIRPGFLDAAPKPKSGASGTPAQPKVRN